MKLERYKGEIRGARGEERKESREEMTEAKTLLLPGDKVSRS